MINDSTHDMLYKYRDSITLQSYLCYVIGIYTNIFNITYAHSHGRKVHINKYLLFSSVSIHVYDVNDGTVPTDAVPSHREGVWREVPTNWPLETSRQDTMSP